MVVTLGRCYQLLGVEVRGAANPAMHRTALLGDGAPTWGLAECREVCTTAFGEDEMGPFKVIWSLSGQDQARLHLPTPSKFVAFLPLSVQGIVSIHKTKGGGAAKHILCLTRVFTPEGCDREESY